MNQLRSLLVQESCLSPRANSLCGKIIGLYQLKSYSRYATPPHIRFQDSLLNLYLSRSQWDVLSEFVIHFILLPLPPARILADLPSRVRQYGEERRQQGATTRMCLEAR